MTFVFVTVVSTLLGVIAATSSCVLVGAFIPTHVADNGWRNSRRISNHRCTVFGPTSSNTFTGLGQHGIAKQNPFNGNTARIATTFVLLVDQKLGGAVMHSTAAANQDQDPADSVDPVTASNGINKTLKTWTKKANGFMTLVLKRIFLCAFKRWVILMAVVLLGGFVRFGAVGRLEVAPFLPLKKAETLSDWSCLAAVYGVIAALLGGLMGFNMADTAAAVQAKNREEDRNDNRNDRKEDRDFLHVGRDREDQFRKEDRDERLTERHERRRDRLEDSIRDLKREMRQVSILPSEKQAISEEIEEKSKKLEEVELELDRIRKEMESASNAVF